MSQKNLLTSLERRTTGNVLKVLDRNIVVVLDPTEKAREKDILRAHRSREKQFAFDYSIEYYDFPFVACAGCLPAFIHCVPCFVDFSDSVVHFFWNIDRSV